MNLNVEKLREACRSGIELAKQQQVEWDKNVDEAEAEWERAWREDILPQWKPFRDELTKAFKNGGHITREMIPVKFSEYSREELTGVYRPFNRGKRRSGWGNSAWVADHRFGPRPSLQITGFEALIDFLEAVADKTIATGQLERAGFRNMHKLFEAAANGVWE